MGDPPYTLLKDLEVAEKKTEEAVTTVVTKNIVLKDGTYATITSTETVGGHQTDESLPHIRRLIGAGDILLGTVACVCLTKLALKAQRDVNRFDDERIFF